MHYPRIVEGLLVKNTVSKGYGLFAQRKHRKNSVILRVHGIRLSSRHPKLSHRAIQIAKDAFIEPKRFSGVWYLNHSCKPNAYVEGKNILARRDIKVGEEITVDYSLFTTFPSWDMECLCRVSGCRRMILPYSRLKEKPKKFVSSYLR